jgi:polyhydroxybutyrate depolymerase
MKKISNIIILAILFFSSTCFIGCITGPHYLVYDGQKRLYNIHLPSSYNPSNSYPLVVVFHGGGGNAENIEKVTNFSQTADEEGFIVVYPYGTGKFNKRLLTWNCGFCCGYALETNVDDVGYIKTLVEHLQDTYAVNSNMIYATGISNGGIMTYRVGAELSDIFAAIAPVCAQIGGQATAEEKMWRIPEPDYPVSVIAFNGMNDTRVPYDGGRPIDNDTHVYSWMSTNESIAFWVEQNQCNTVPQQNISGSRKIIVNTYSGGINDTELKLVCIVDGTHSWPGGQKGWKNGPVPTQEISATQMMWNFFKHHPKKE